MLFDNEYQDSGIYNPELTEPDYTNAQNSALWELHTLRVLLEFIRLFFNRIESNLVYFISVTIATMSNKAPTILFNKA